MYCTHVLGSCSPNFGLLSCVHYTRKKSEIRARVRVLHALREVRDDDAAIIFLEGLVTRLILRGSRLF